MADTEADAADASATVVALPAEAASAEVPVEAAAPVPDVVPDPAAIPNAEPVVEAESAVGEVAVQEAVPETEIAEPEPAAQEPPASVSTHAPTPAPAPASIVSPVLKMGLEKIRFRKRAKLEKIIALAREKHSITNDDVQLAVQVSDATATRYLSQLVHEGRLRRVRRKNNQHTSPFSSRLAQIGRFEPVGIRPFYTTLRRWRLYRTTAEPRRSTTRLKLLRLTSAGELQSRRPINPPNRIFAAKTTSRNPPISAPRWYLVISRSYHKTTFQAETMPSTIISASSFSSSLSL